MPLMARVLLLSTLLLIATALACSKDQGPASGDAAISSEAGIAPSEAFPQAPEAVVPTPPDADPFEITQRLRVKSQEPIPRVMRSPTPPKQVGHSESFTVTDLQNFTRSQVTATLRVVTPHAYWYADNALQVDPSALERSAQEFEAKIYPTDVRYFGDTIKGGFDGDPHLTILTTSFNGAAGYYSSPDEYPQVVHPFSNQRLMLYINGNILRPGSQSFNCVVAHELQHAIHWHADRSEASWVNEGLSTLAEELNGCSSFSAQLFQRSSNVQLTFWEDAPSNNGLHYATAHLFLRFLGQHWGGFEKLKELVAEPKDSVAGIDAYLAKQGFTQRFRDVFKDWVVANSGGNNPDSRYRYDGLQVQARASRQISQNTEFSDQVHQFAAKYIEIKPGKGPATVSFGGAPFVKLLPAEAHSGRAFWWSNRGDSIDSTLTKAFDLTGLTKASLRFWTWFDLEKGWDYTYVEVSDDGGTTWTILPGTHASHEDPLGNSYGPGYTGTSGGGKEPQWVEESIDLTSYAGKKVLVRFEYITDEAVNKDGLALDDIEVPELGFRDDAEEDRGWDARGFLRTDNLLKEDFLVQLQEFRPNGSMVVRDLPLNAQQQGQVELCCFGQDLERVVVVVAALAPATTQPASFQLSVQAGQ